MYRYATVGGGRSNKAEGEYATVAGGYGNAATNDDTTVCGGGSNKATQVRRLPGSPMTELKRLALHRPTAANK